MACASCPAGTTSNDVGPPCSVANIVTGSCELSDKSVTSRDYPKDYRAGYACKVTINAAGTLQVASVRHILRVYQLRVLK